MRASGIVNRDARATAWRRWQKVAKMACQRGASSGTVSNQASGQSEAQQRTDQCMQGGRLIALGMEQQVARRRPGIGRQRRDAATPATALNQH